MNAQLQIILEKIKQANLSENEKEDLIRAVSDADKKQNLAEFKLDRIEKDRHTLSVMLEETIEDLQKKTKAIEEKNRELEIEAALERVRTRTMAMNKSEELQETSYLLFQQLRELGENADQISIGIVNEEEKIIELSSTFRGNQFSKALRVAIDQSAVMQKVFAGWKDQKKYLVIELTGKELADYNHFRNQFNEVRIETHPGDRWIIHAIYFSKGILTFSSSEVRPPETIQLLQRFAAVFDLTYTRFLDLKNAEAQARESQIQLALERIRAASMAMQKSDELLDVINIFSDQLAKLNIYFDNVSFGVNAERDEFKFWLASPGQPRPILVHVPYLDNPAPNRVIEAQEKGLRFFADVLTLEENKTWNEHLINHSEIKFFPDKVKEYLLKSPGFARSTFLLKNIKLYIGNYKNVPYTDEENNIFKRFAETFEQSYTRFLDLQKAETQSKEAQIEAALERVRAKAMAMHKTNDFNGAVETVFKELQRLNLGMHRCGIAILNKETISADVWITAMTDEGSTMQITGDEALNAHPLLQGAFDSWVRKEDFSYVLQGEELVSYYSGNSTIILPHTSDTVTGWLQQYYHFASFGAGGLFAFRDSEFSDEAKKIMKRFIGVFELTYKRFLDLQKAEAQAREAQIEAALERVRAKAMAMHKSEDLNAAVAVVFNELDKLDLGVLRCGISVLNKEKRTGDIWVTSTTDKGSAVQISGDESFDIHPLLQGAFEAWLRQEDYDYELEGDDLTAYYNAVKAANFQLPESQMISSEKEFKKQYCNVAVYHAGGLFAFQGTAFTEEAKKVMKRFANVFDLTYKRFLDLQKAEAQAREAQIEASLERVRTVAMGMKQPVDMLDVCHNISDQLQLLNIIDIRNVQTIIIYESKYEYINYQYFAPYNKNSIEQIDYRLHPVELALAEKMLTSKEAFYSKVFEGEELQIWRDHRKATNQLADPRLDEVDAAYYYFYSIGSGGMGVTAYSPLNEEALVIFKRFRNVFELAYKRYLDIELAETQAHEAQIEAALERVRGKAMAMHNTNDLSSATSTAFTELRKLGINPLRFGVGLLSKESRKALLYSAVSSSEGESLALVGWVMLTGHPVLEDIYESWLRNEDIFPVLSGPELKSYYDQLLSGLSVPSIPDWQTGEKQYGHFFPFSIGCLYAWAEKPFNEADVKILKRFASIIDLTFRRYMDLQKSEANAKDAVKQAALDRVRAEIASMRTVSDLDRITPLVWNELNILGVPFARCGVFIMDDEQKLIHTFLSTPEGKAIAAFHLPYATGGNIPLVLENWKTKSIYTDHWDEVAFASFANELVKQGALSTSQQYLSTIPKGGFYLHFLPFLQGMLYVGSLKPLTEDQINLVQSVAEAFSTAYARYEDFNRLEAAKQEVERTLVDLKQTQQQLVQSEKMASLGEMTAGIAHEIQNPLNFVNNFSEVSNELLEEMKQELAIGNGQLALELASDVKQNLEKILHHGKRADAIVKSMLQHSRSSSGKKEPTDINALADEYLRLAYHGLRAKDKTFNAKFESRLDSSIEKINVMPQEIGRVILNLINNAFYAVSEKKKAIENGYEPVVTVTTKNFGDKISITVNDNGNGIPQKILDKIFQPFFTTKPTGEGTGLGLSLSYDIISKGHGGELQVNTKEGEGAEFIILLPIR